jgi:hypothetical protein
MLKNPVPAIIYRAIASGAGEVHILGRLPAQISVEVV